MGYNGTALLDKTVPVTIKENVSMPAVCMPAGAYPTLNGENTFVFCILYDENGKRISDNHLLLSKYYEMKLEQPNIQIDFKGETAVFTTDKPAFGVCLDLDGTNQLDDNMFDLLPGIPYTIGWDGQQPPQVLYTLNDSMLRERIK